MNILDWDYEKINTYVSIAYETFKTGSKVCLTGYNVKNVYFVGTTLCIDLIVPHNNIEVITINYTKQTYGYFSGGARRLLPLKALQLLEKTCEIAKINIS